MDLLHAGMIVPAAVGLCCVAGDARRHTFGEVIPAIAMLLAMADQGCAAVLGAPLVTPVAWSAVLIGCAVLSAAAHRRGERAVVDRGPGAAHRSVALVVMAGLVLVTSAHGPLLSGPLLVDPAAHSGPVVHGHGGVLLAGLLAAAAVVVIGPSVRFLMRDHRRSRQDGLVVADAAAMSAGTAMMTLAALL